MKVFSVFNIKGGVGKTAAAVNLAYLTAQSGARTLLWDLDPQGAATFYYRIQATVQGGAERLLDGTGSINQAIRATDFPGLDMVPADFSYRNLDHRLGELKKSTRRLAGMLEEISEPYDCVFLDCAPSIALVSENVFEASDYLLTPTIPTTLSLRTLAQLMGHLKKREGKHRPRVLPFFSMVDRRKTLHRQTCDWALEQPLGFLETAIPYASLVERMGVQKSPLPCYAPNAAPTQAFRQLWTEISTRIDP